MLTEVVEKSRTEQQKARARKFLEDFADTGWATIGVDSHWKDQPWGGTWRVDYVAGSGGIWKPVWLVAVGPVATDH